MANLIELLKVNVAFYDFLSKGIPEDENESEMYIEKIFAFLDKREKLLPAVTAPETEEEKRIALTVLDYQKKIENKLNENKLLLKKDLMLLKQKKSQNKCYDNPYEKTYNDGIFFDKKK